VTTLARLFNPDRLDSENPNDPAVRPLLVKEQSLKNQAFVIWYEEVGHYLIDSLERALIGKIVRAIGHKRETTEDMISNMRLLDDIQKDISFVDHIVSAFEEEKKRKEKLAG
jgi:hypothetical protein